MLTNDINKIIADLHANKIVSVATDTVYGLSCVISQQAVSKIIQLKQRDSNKGFIIISSDYRHLLKYVDISKLNEDQKNLIISKPNIPTTWIVPAKKEVLWLTGGKPTIAVRLVNTQTIKAICSRLDGGLISTSANISGKCFINTPEAINETFPNITILNTVNKNASPSRIINLITNERLR